MVESKLISIAMLETDLREKRVNDPLEYFEKWVLYVLHKGSYNIASTTLISKDIQEIFGIDVPRPVIDRLLRKLKTKGFLIPNRDGTLKVQKTKLVRLNFKPIEKARNDFKRMLTKLVENFVEFVRNNFHDESFSLKTAEDLISTYLDSKSVQILDYIMESRQFPQPITNHKHAYYIASFLKHLMERE